MSLFIASLNSGSNGNCYYVGNDNEAVLVDAGISCREIEKRMRGLGLDAARLKAVFITHEHTDHISGLPVLVKKYRIPVYITHNTYEGTRFLLDQNLVHSFTAFEPVIIGSLAITAFPKWHDAADPHSMVVTCEGITIGVFTDIGEPCKHVIKYFKKCHAAFLETNYDEAMLANSSYPSFLKNRISGRQGHLSNNQALQLFIAHRSSSMTHLLLSHLSKENNEPAIAEGLFKQHAGGINVVHAPRDRATAVYQVSAGAGAAIVSASSLAVRKVLAGQLQLNLF
ncbi:MAG: MBL fold metallo-hydrolase [Bacteroidota bacterium]